MTDWQIALTAIVTVVVAVVLASWIVDEPRGPARRCERPGYFYVPAAGVCVQGYVPDKPP